ncbi:MAG: hypothetical protein AB9903_31570 [Vulcanimicrobiota bacterium]
MKKTLVVIAIMMLVVMIAGVAQAKNDTVDQTVTITVNEVAKISASGGATFVITDPTEGGDDPTIATTNTGKCGYTSVIAKDKTRTLTAEITSADDPATYGLTLTLIASGVPSDCGTTASAVTLTTTTSPTVISNIKSCKTGKSAVTLTYGLTISDITKLYSDAIPSVTVTLTLTDSN